MTTKLPDLSAMLEDFLPPQFRGNVPDDVRPAESRPAAATSTTSSQNRSTESGKNLPDNSNRGMCARIETMILQFRRNLQQGSGQEPQRKPVEEEEFPSKASKKYISRSLRRSASHRRSIKLQGLLAKLRNIYISTMNNVATYNIFAGGNHEPAMYNASASTRKFDAESIAKLIALERSRSKPDTEYRNNMTYSQSSSARVKPCGDVLPSQLLGKPGAHTGGEPVLSRSRSIRYTIDDRAFFSRNGSRNGSRRKNHVNPYADSDWKPGPVCSDVKAASSGANNNFQFRWHQMNSKR